MSKLFENAVISIQLGVEDFQANDPRRAVSAVRNFYAGVLLLAKETLARAAPNADLDELIAAKYKPTPDGEGGIEVVPDGHTTIDFVTIGKRFKDFGLAIDQKALEDLNRIRNDIEHLYTQKPTDAVRESIAKAFPVVVQLFEYMEERPGDHLGEAWPVMLEAKELYDKELQRCRDTLSKIQWISSTIAASGLLCSACESRLIRQQDRENTRQEHMELLCHACGECPDTDDTIVKSLESALSGEAYLRAKDTGDDGPQYHCSECGNDSYVDFEEQCAVCGHEYESESCNRCGNSLSLNEIIQGEYNGLCDYCGYMSDKIMRE